MGGKQHDFSDEELTTTKKHPNGRRFSFRWRWEVPWQALR